MTMEKVPEEGRVWERRVKSTNQYGTIRIFSRRAQKDEKRGDKKGSRNEKDVVILVQYYNTRTIDIYIYTRAHDIAAQLGRDRTVRT